MENTVSEHQTLKINHLQLANLNKKLMLRKHLKADTKFNFKVLI